MAIVMEKVLPQNFVQIKYSIGCPIFSKGGLDLFWLVGLLLTYCGRKEASRYDIICTLNLIKSNQIQNILETEKHNLTHFTQSKIVRSLERSNLELPNFAQCVKVSLYYFQISSFVV